VFERSTIITERRAMMAETENSFGQCHTLSIALTNIDKKIKGLFITNT
jgi:hypothetical protein